MKGGVQLGQRLSGLLKRRVCRLLADVLGRDFQFGLHVPRKLLDPMLETGNRFFKRLDFRHYRFRSATRAFRLGLVFINSGGFGDPRGELLELLRAETSLSIQCVSDVS